MFLHILHFLIKSLLRPVRGPALPRAVYPCKNQLTDHRKYYKLNPVKKVSLYQEHDIYSFEKKKCCYEQFIVKKYMFVRLPTFRKMFQIKAVYVNDMKRRTVFVDLHRIWCAFIGEITEIRICSNLKTELLSKAFSQKVAISWEKWKTNGSFLIQCSYRIIQTNFSNWITSNGCLPRLHASSEIKPLAHNFWRPISKSSSINESPSTEITPY